MIGSRSGPAITAFEEQNLPKKILPIRIPIRLTPTPFATLKCRYDGEGTSANRSAEKTIANTKYMMKHAIPEKILLTVKDSRFADSAFDRTDVRVKEDPSFILRLGQRDRLRET